MNAVSLWQPWASLMVIPGNRGKRNETRDWYTSFRGRILIHAAKKVSGELRETFMIPNFRDALTRAGYSGFDALPFGAIIGAVTIVDCVRVEKVRDHISEDEYSFGNYSNGRWAWITEDQVRVDPIPCRGMQKIFRIPDDVAALCRERAAQR